MKSTATSSIHIGTAALLCLSLGFGSALAASQGSPRARLVSSRPGVVSFEIEVPAARIVGAEGGAVRVLLEGFGTFSPAGAREYPGATFRVAVPPSGEPRVAWTILEEESVGRVTLARVPGERFVKGEDGIAATERYAAPDPWAPGYAPPVVEAGRASFMGRQRVLPIRVNPLVVEGGEGRLVRRLSVTVSFESPSAAGVFESVAPPTPSTSAGWRRLYRDLLVNPADVDRYAKPLAARPAAAAPFEQGKRLKIMIPETGLYSIRADSLVAAGLSGTLGTGQIALRKYYYDEAQPDLVREVDVPMLVVEGASTSPYVFDGDDRIVFYALGVKDDAAAGDTIAAFTDDNVIWLEEDAAGAVMLPAPPLQTSSDIAVASFRATHRERKDTYYLRRATPGSKDYYFVKSPAPKEFSFPFQMRSVAAAGTAAVVVSLQGWDEEGYSHPLAFYVRNSTAGTHQLGTGYVIAQERKTFTFPSSPISWFVEGTNELYIVCAVDYAYLLNSFTVQYPGRFIAHDNMLEFGLEGSIDIQGVGITGFTVNSGFLVEITDPLHPLYNVLTPADFVADGSGYKLMLNIETATSRRYVVVGAGAGAAVPVRSMRVDAPSDLKGETGRRDLAIVTHADFKDRIGEYASYRAAQGWRVITADIEDVYDEFNGGLPSPYAIKRFLRYGFDAWGIEYALLVGDGSQDHKRVNKGPAPSVGEAGIDFVPAYNYCMNVSGGGFQDEVVSSDSWYAFLDDLLPVTGAASESGAPAPEAAAAAPAAGSGVLQDGFPDIFIGRFPVGRDVELRAIINKVKRFESPEMQDAWRRHIVLSADDAWSGGRPDYRYRSYEKEFQWSTDSCGTAIERALPGGFDVDRLFLAPYTAPAHPDSTEFGIEVDTRARAATRATYCPALFRSINEGCLLFLFQGHSNRAGLATETVFSNFSQYSDSDSIRALTPFLFTGFGCHICDFDIYNEPNRALQDGPNGDCIGEALLFKPTTGSIGTFGSTGYEYLSQNANFAERIFRVVFESPPDDSVPPQNEYTGAHWVLAEALTKASIQQIGATSYGLDMVTRYILLGDPLLAIDPGPPLMRLEADWGAGFEPMDPDTFRARRGTNRCRLRLTASDVVALGAVRLAVGGEDWTDSLVVTPLGDVGKTYARSYRAELDYTVDPADESLVFSVSTPAGREAGVMEVPLETRVRLFYNDYLEIQPGVESPPTGLFKVTVDFPAYLAAPPALLLDGLEQPDAVFAVPNPADSLHWEATMRRTLPAGDHVLTVRSGGFSRDFAFRITGEELVVNAFNFPNPFTRETNIIYTLNLAVDAGTIEIYTVSGTLIRTIALSRDRLLAASYLSPQSVVWDGRDGAGDRVANGTYLYVIRLERAGKSSEITGKAVKLE